MVGSRVAQTTDAAPASIGLAPICSAPSHVAVRPGQTESTRMRVLGKFCCQCARQRVERGLADAVARRCTLTLGEAELWIAVGAATAADVDNPRMFASEEERQERLRDGHAP